MVENIHPIFENTLNANEKQLQLNQVGIVIWMVGLSGSGKSTLATGLENRLHGQGYHTMLLDGDNLRAGVNNNLGFTEEDRLENVRRTAEVSKLFALNGTVTICSLISPTKEVRTLAHSIIGDRYCEIFINCPIEICEQRDVKGLYAKARNGEIENFTGIDAPFEEPESANLVVKTDQLSLEESLDLLVKHLIPKIQLKS